MPVPQSSEAGPSRSRTPLPQFSEAGPSRQRQQEYQMFGRPSTPELPDDAQNYDMYNDAGYYNY
jgi:hypothetical protein